MGKTHISPRLKRPIERTRPRPFAAQQLLHRVHERDRVTEDILADAQDRNSSVRDAQRREGRAWEHEGLLADPEQGLRGVEVIARFLGVGGELCPGLSIFFLTISFRRHWGRDVKGNNAR